MLALMPTPTPLPVLTPKPTPLPKLTLSSSLTFELNP